jgi:hypothetical protein
LVAVGVLGCPHGKAIADDSGNLALHQISRESRQAVQVIVRPAILDCYILAFNKPCLLEALAKCCDEVCEGFGGCAAEKAHDWHRGLLRRRSKRPAQQPSLPRER